MELSTKSALFWQEQNKYGGRRNSSFREDEKLDAKQAYKYKALGIEKPDEESKTEGKDEEVEIEIDPRKVALEANLQDPVLNRPVEFTKAPYLDRLVTKKKSKNKEEKSE